MKLLAIIILALVGGFVLYEESPEFRNNVDEFVEELENQQHRQNVDLGRAEMEVQSAARPNTNRHFGLPSASVGRGPDYYSFDRNKLAERNRQMRSKYNDAVSTLRSHHSRDEKTTRAMTDYYKANYNRDASLNSYRQYRD